MTPPTPILVVDRDGVRGEVLETRAVPPRASDGAPAGGPHLRVQFAGRPPVWVARELLRVRSDGTLELPVPCAELLEQDERRILTLAREEVVVDKHSVERSRVRIHKRVREHEAHLDEPLLEEHLEVERVEVGRFVDEPPRVEARDDGTLVVPCVQEVLVLEKRLLLKEELHVKRVQHTRHARRNVTLREEVLEVERRPATEATSERRSPRFEPSTPPR